MSDNTSPAQMRRVVGQVLHTFNNCESFPVSSSFLDERIPPGVTEMLLRIPIEHSGTVSQFVRSLTPHTTNHQDEEGKT